MRHILNILLVTFLLLSCREYPDITIDTSKKLHRTSIQLNGTNIEDLNFQCYGGIYSQLLYGQDFEEHVDVDFLDLPVKSENLRGGTGPARYVTFIVLDENGKPYLTTRTVYFYGDEGINPVGNPVTKPYELNSHSLPGTVIPLDSLTLNEQKLLLERVNGDKQISRYWREYNTGNAQEFIS